MLHLCSQCLADTHFIQDGHDEEGRKFKLYHCPTCDSYVRDFYLSERETVDESIDDYRQWGLMPKSLDLTPTQLPLFTVAMPRVSED